ncbi:translation initiation factor Sui1 [Stutzerimonas kirkiae]|uniref:translation initiation factor Sui1 n=1 Tax=Stutzerimonas kirkiae TaxID=2211392 RepID=UPI0010385B2A|nr:translation initiation factor Sui1 [Stutzerimonas kirkiae]TBV06612.1 translation initiation factor [Stutzerimonas kirkiae]TBV13092.1 translation initiation factor [Stutzerimonas kirkiae]
MVKKGSSFSDLGTLVYSTDGGRQRPAPEQPKLPEGDGIARVRRESKGRGGKTVTTIAGVPLLPDELKALAGELKRRCGTGGSLKDGVIEIQGDHVQLLIDELLRRGFKAKKSGG